MQSCIRSNNLLRATGGITAEVTLWLVTLPHRAKGGYAVVPKFVTLLGIGNLQIQAHAFPSPS